MKQVNTDRIAQVTLQYHGQKKIRVYESDLPWKNGDSIIIVAVEKIRGGSVIPTLFPVEDPSPTSITIAPGAKLTGNINLSSRFGDLNSVLKLHDVILFWSYEMAPIGSGAMPRVAGSLLIRHEGH